MTDPINRRTILRGSGALIAGSTFKAATGWASGQAPSDRVVVGVMGLQRGRALAVGFSQEPGVLVKYTCDVDRKRAEAGAQAVSQADGATPEAIQDFRKILDDPEVDALLCAAPNHWHAPATILACNADKHVYVEKPCSHNPHEGELMVKAARQHNKAVQMGAQRRSSPQVIEAIAALRDGAIGRVYHARTYYNSNRGSIGHAEPSNPPAHIDYGLWQGPAPRKPFKSNVVHYNWHWFWHWGNGELGNNGVHALDLARWGLGVDYPTHVVSTGARLAFDDDQQTPDTHTVSYQFPNGLTCDWQGLSCNGRGLGPFVSFYGTEGSLDILVNGSYAIYDLKGNETKKVSGGAGQRQHFADFVKAVREDEPLALNAEILEGHKSTLLCHLGNIAQRVGRALACDPKDGRIRNDDEAMAYWKRAYEPGWEPKVS